MGGIGDRRGGYNSIGADCDVRNDRTMFICPCIHTSGSDPCSSVHVNDRWGVDEKFWLEHPTRLPQPMDVYMDAWDRISLPQRWYVWSGLAYDAAAKRGYPRGSLSSFPSLTGYP